MIKLMRVVAVVVSVIGAASSYSFADASSKEKQAYRDLVLSVRTQAEFKIPMPDKSDMHFKYKMEFDQPKWKEPVISDSPVGQSNLFVRDFWEKIFLKEGSYVEVGGEQIPLTCIHVAGQDNRFSGKLGPLFPELILKITFVTNDWACAGPVRPGWPQSGGRKEAWETYIHYTVKDPTIMLPIDAGLRYRWNEFEAVLVK